MINDENGEQKGNSNKRAISRLWHFLTRGNHECIKKLTQGVTVHEIRVGIKSHQNSRAIGTDHIHMG